ncbi:hypothetical protein GHT06_015153 [Daphnia sinensis]|uniref:CCHC-type domain-containing protein n=1 Tax=Daphnia sinensis TaxID=1820382 RepID=A0AAD5LAJ6_9CRUS|nr:hypothetical protein GHT06_015153 [Daphnia sinensis]
MSDSEHDESSLSPELAKSLRKLCRSKFTKLCTAIEAGIAASKNIAVLEEQKETLTELYEECMLDQRAQMVWDLENCFRCLGRNHLSRDCKKENLRCTVPNCNSSAHHTMIHDAARISTQSNRATVWVKTATGEYRRPVVKLCLLRHAEDSSLNINRNEQKQVAYAVLGRTTLLS